MFYAVLLAGGEVSALYTQTTKRSLNGNRGPRPDYNDFSSSKVRVNRSPKRTFTEDQRTALQSQVMCNVLGTLGEYQHQTTIMNDKEPGFKLPNIFQSKIEVRLLSN